mgnify:FL=1
MRRIFLLAAIAVLGFSSCKKDEKQLQQDPIQLTLTAEIETPATKATYTYDEGIKMAWEAEERITIVTFKDDKAVSAQNLSSTGVAGRKTATFSGSFTPTDGATYIACYPPLEERTEYWITEVESGRNWGLRIDKNAEFLTWVYPNSQDYQSENGSLDILKVGDVMVGDVEINEDVATTTLRKTISVLKLVLNLPDVAVGDKLYSVQVNSQGGFITTGTWVQYNQMETPFMWDGGGLPSLSLGLGSAGGMDTPGNKQLVVYIPDALGKIPEGNLVIKVYGKDGNYVKTISIPEQKNMQAGFVYTITADLVKE